MAMTKGMKLFQGFIILTQLYPMSKIYHAELIMHLPMDKCLPAY